MRVAIQYRIDVHAYDAHLGHCDAACLACHLERFAHRSPDEAIGAQPPELIEDGRYELVPLDIFAT